MQAEEIMDKKIASAMEVCRKYNRIKADGKKAEAYGSIIWIWLRMPNIQKKPKCMRNMQTKL